MTNQLVFTRNRATVNDVVLHLKQCATAFVPQLGNRVDILVYAEKLVCSAVCFEAWSGNALVGLVAAYLNNKVQSFVFISNVSVLPSHQGLGIASSLLTQCLAQTKASGFKRAELEVGYRNLQAIRLYLKMGFFQRFIINHSIRMYSSSDSRNLMP